MGKDHLKKRKLGVARNDDIKKAAFLLLLNILKANY